MTFEQLMSEIETTANRCDKTIEQQAVKAVLLSLLGAMHSRQQVALMNYLYQFNEQQLQRLTASRN